MNTSRNSTKSKVACVVHPWVPYDDDEMLIKPSFEDNYLDHKSNLNIKSNLSENVPTTIACAVLHNVTRDLIEGFCRKGVTMLMINFYGLSFEQSRKMVNEIRQGVFNYSIRNNEVPYAMALVLDLEGPRITTGTILKTKDEVYAIDLPTNEHVYITNDAEYKDKCTADRIYVNSDTILQLKENDRIYLDYGKIELAVERVDSDELFCLIIRGEVLGSKRAMHTSVVSVGPARLTEQDMESISTGIKLKVDIIMIPGVKDDCFFNYVKKFVCQEKCGNVDLYAKVDNGEGLENIDEIIRNADGVFLHRPNLSMDIGHDKMFLAQKIVLSKCILARKPTVVHGGFLNSLEYSTLSSGDEINDIVNTVLDGVDCIYLDVTKRSPNPVHCVQCASTVCRKAEVAVWEQRLFSELNKKSKPRIDPIHAISIGCVEVSLQCHAAAIIVITTSGLSAKLIASYRPRCPVLAIVKHGKFARKISVYRNLTAVHFIDLIETNWSKDVQNRTKFAIKFGKKKGLFKQGDMVMRMSCLEQNAGFTNTMNLFYVDSEERT